MLTSLLLGELATIDRHFDGMSGKLL